MSNEISPIEQFRVVANNAIKANADLLDLWRKIDIAQLNEQLTPDDKELLRQLILKRIDILCPFACLLHHDRREAIDILLTRYVGHSVSPYSKFGGYEFELSAMLADLIEIGGHQSLRDLVADPRFDRGKLNDQNLISSFCTALGLENADEFAAWIDDSANAK